MVRESDKYGDTPSKNLAISTRVETLQGVIWHSWNEALLGLADKLPTGRTDEKASEKMQRETQEYQECIAAGDMLGALLEAGDVVYYAAKCAHNGVMSEKQARLHAESVVGAAFSFEQALCAAHVKYNLRARPGNPKNDAQERLAVSVMLAEMEN